ncbi:MAG: hypothetical protein AAFR21_06895 [Pseudomonadota bacterium]
MLSRLHICIYLACAGLFLLASVFQLWRTEDIPIVSLGGSTLQQPVTPHSHQALYRARPSHQTLVAYLNDLQRRHQFEEIKELARDDQAPFDVPRERDLWQAYAAFRLGQYDDATALLTPYLAASQPRDDAEAHLMAANIQYAKQPVVITDLLRAERAALTADPRLASSVWRAKARRALAKGKSDYAISAARRYVEAGGEEGFVDRIKVEALIRQKTPLSDDQLSEIRSTIEAAQGGESGQSERGWSLTRILKLERSSKNVNRHGTLGEYENARLAAMLACRLGRYIECAQALDSVAEDLKFSPRGDLLRGVSKALSGDLAQAFKLISDHRGRAPDDWVAADIAFHLARRQKDLVQARDALGVLRSEQPRLAILNEFLMAIEADDPDQALAAVNLLRASQSIEQGETDALPTTGLGYLFGQWAAFPLDRAALDWLENHTVDNAAKRVRLGEPGALSALDTYLSASELLANTVGDNVISGMDRSERIAVLKRLSADAPKFWAPVQLMVQTIVQARVRSYSANDQVEVATAAANELISEFLAANPEHVAARQWSVKWLIENNSYERAYQTAMEDLENLSLTDELVRALGGIAHDQAGKSGLLAFTERLTASPAPIRSTQREIWAGDLFFEFDDPEAAASAYKSILLSGDIRPFDDLAAGAEAKRHTQIRDRYLAAMKKLGRAGEAKAFLSELRRVTKDRERRAAPPLEGEKPDLNDTVNETGREIASDPPGQRGGGSDWQMSDRSASLTPQVP